MLPVGCVAPLSVRVDDPAVAVMVTDVAFTLCQFNVTLWPALMALALAENISVGAPDFPAETPVQAHNAAIKISAAEQPIQRKVFLLIVFFLSAPKALYPKTRAMVRCRATRGSWLLLPRRPAVWEPEIKGKVQQKVEEEKTRAPERLPGWLA